MSTKSCIAPGEALGIIAGSGALFSMVWEEALNQHLKPVIVSFKDSHQFNNDEISETLHLQTTLGKIGEILSFFKSHGVKYLIFAGRVPRPSFSSLSFDKVGLKWMQKLGIKTFGGDDTLLKGVTDLLAQEGFEIISPREFLPNLVLKPGVYTTSLPNDADNKDIERGQMVLSALSNADVGQACIVQEGVVLGIEAIEGTQRLIERCSGLKRQEKGGVLIKIAKENQSTLVDLPTIGINTIEALHHCKLNGVIISANTTQVLDFNQVIELCNKYNIFLKVIKV
jgi:UDP-2,3-diacylglucosamine hydrolase